MATITWKNDKSGNWSTGANWSSGSLPGSGDNAVISTADPHTITHSMGLHSIAKLNVAAADTLAITGGKLVVSGAATLAGNLVESAGTFGVGAGSFSTGGITQTGGTLAVNAGVFNVKGTNSFGGTIAGAGTLDLSTGSNTLAAGLALNVGKLVIGSAATVTLGGNLAYAGTLADNGGTIDSGGETLTLSGAASGLNLVDTALVLTGTMTGGLNLFGSTLDNFGVLNGTIDLTYGQGNLQLSEAFTNEAGGTINTSGINSRLDSGVNTNDGVINFTGSGEVFTSLTNLGTINIEAGATMTVSGFHEASQPFLTYDLGGVVSGAGTLDIGTGVDFQPGVSLSVAAIEMTQANAEVPQNSFMTFASDASYAGSLTMNSGGIGLNGHALTLSGVVDFADIAPPLNAPYSNIDNSVSGGTLTLAGTTAIASLSADTLVNTGAITQIAVATGDYGFDVSLLVNQAGATYQMQNGAQITPGTLDTVGTLENFGAISASGQTAIDIATINAGTVQAMSGTLTFGSAVSGGGTLLLAANAGMAFNANVGAGGLVSLGANTSLAVDATDGFGATIANFAAADIITLDGLGWNSNATASFNTSNDQLSVMSGSANTTLQFAGSYTSASFSLFDNQGTVAVTHS